MNKTIPVSFRLDAESKIQIEKRAELKGVRVSEFAREVVLEALNDESELAKLRMQISTFRQELSAIREDLAVAVKALLVTSSSKETVTPEDAQRWVEMNMNS